jgi:hypothetical protein
VLKVFSRWCSSEVLEVIGERICLGGAQASEWWVNVLVVTLVECSREGEVGRQWLKLRACTLLLLPVPSLGELLIQKSQST